jgi:hypothetical protein
MALMLERPRDCPECNSAGSVIRDFCEVCYADQGEFCESEASLAVAGVEAEPELEARPPLHPAIRLRFADVVEELRAIGEMASKAVEVEGSRLAIACSRAESLLRILRLQFMDDIGIGERQRSAVS